MFRGDSGPQWCTVGLQWTTVGYSGATVETAVYPRVSTVETAVYPRVATVDHSGVQWWLQLTTVVFSGGYSGNQCRDHPDPYPDPYHVHPPCTAPPYPGTHYPGTHHPVHHWCTRSMDVNGWAGRQECQFSGNWCQWGAGKYRRQCHLGY